MLRVIIVGARRRRQGLGEFVARAFHRIGADVRGVVGTSEESAKEAATSLYEKHGISCVGYPSLDAALDEEAVDAVAICSPISTHRGLLERVAEGGLHCLSEKPLWWSDNWPAAVGTTPDDGASNPSHHADFTEVIAERFAAESALLTTITHWPTTLPAFYALFPATAGRPVGRFEMHLSPITTGVRMALDSMSHPLSLLEALCGVGEVESPRAVYGEEGDLTLRFQYAPRERYEETKATEVVARLVRHAAPPRPAGYAIDGCAVERMIELPSYEISFVATIDGRERRQPVPDPVTALVRDFVEGVASGRSTDRAALVSGMRGLERLVAAAAAAEPQGRVDTREASASD